MGNVVFTVFVVIVVDALRENAVVYESAVYVGVGLALFGYVCDNTADGLLYLEGASYVDGALIQTGVNVAGDGRLIHKGILYRLPILRLFVYPEGNAVVGLPALVGNYAEAFRYYLTDECGGEKSVGCGLVEADVDAVFTFLKKFCYICLHFLLLEGNEVAVYVKIEDIVAEEACGGLFYLVKGEEFS